MKELGFNTCGKVAFATNLCLDSGDSALITLANSILQIDPASQGQVALVRRPVNVSYTMAATDLKIRMERKDDDAPQRLAQAERSARSTSKQKGAPGRLGSHW